MKKIEERDNGKDVNKVEEEKEKQAISEETNENISWVEEIKKVIQLINLDYIETIQDGEPDLRLCKARSYKSSRWGSRPNIMFVTVEWYQRSWGGFQDAGFFFKSNHMSEWQVAPIADWMQQYVTKEDFLKRFPEFKDIFREYPIIPRKKIKIEFSNDGENKVAEGWAFFDGEYVKIDDYKGNKWSVEPWKIDSIQEIKDKGIDFKILANKYEQEFNSF